MHTHFVLLHATCRYTKTQTKRKKQRITKTNQKNKELSTTIAKHATYSNKVCMFVPR